MSIEFISVKNISSMSNEKQIRMKFLLTACLIILVSLQTTAQKELKSFDSTTFKVNSLKGIELKIESPYASSFQPLSSIGAPLHFNFVNERAISSSSTLLLKAGINVTPGVFYEDTTYNYEFNLGQKIGRKVSFCSFGFNFGAEPRWYWNFQKRAHAGKARLNSGWFLSLPLEVNFPKVAMLNGPTINFKNGDWITDQIILLYSLGISTGYRFALSKRLYLESSVEIQASGDWTKYGDFDRWWPIGIMPQLEIRLGYTFKK
jgi:hypothetical protein